MVREWSEGEGSKGGKRDRKEVRSQGIKEGRKRARETEEKKFVIQRGTSSSTVKRRGG